MLSPNTDFNVMTWVKKGLQLFHCMSYQDSLKIKIEMIAEILHTITKIIGCLRALIQFLKSKSKVSILRHII